MINVHFNHLCIKKNKRPLYKYSNVFIPVLVKVSHKYLANYLLDYDSLDKP